MKDGEGTEGKKKKLLIAKGASVKIRVVFSPSCSYYNLGQKYKTTPQLINNGVKI